MALSVPRQHRRVVGKLLEMEPSSLENALAVMGAIDPAPLSTDRMGSELADRAGLATGVGKDLLNFILSLHSLRYSGYVSEDRVVQEVTEAVESDDSFESTPEAIEKLKGFISSSLELSNLRLASKALVLITGYESLFLGARIYSDLRPVFENDVGEPQAFTSSHVLNLTVRRATTTKDLYIALDSQDLDDLSATLKRAQEKEGRLRETVKKMGAKFLSLED